MMRLRRLIAISAALAVPSMALTAVPAFATTTVATWSDLQSVFTGVSGGSSLTIALGADMAPASGQWLGSLNTGGGSSLSSGATVTLDLAGHDLDIEAPSNAPAIGVEYGATLIIQDSIGGGTLTVVGGSNSSGIGNGDSFAMDGFGQVIINSGTVVASTGDNGTGIGATGVNGGRVEINGGNVTATGDDNPGIGGYDDLEIFITGGTIVATGGFGGAGIGTGEGGDAPSITISGGDVNAAGGYGSPGIGSGWDSDGPNLVITDATITATGGEYGAGLGGGEYTHVGGSVSIERSTITAIGSRSGAGIGTAGDSDDFDSIYIADSEVIAASNPDDYSLSSGAGIGGGSDSEVASIIIERSTVLAGGGSGAGIGGGSGGSGRDLLIVDSTILAAGNVGSAGIGGGEYYGSGGTITIQGCSNIQANGGDAIGLGGGAGIGAGYVGMMSPGNDPGTVTIEGVALAGAPTDGGDGADPSDTTYSTAGLGAAVSYTGSGDTYSGLSRAGLTPGAGGQFKLSCEPAPEPAALAATGSELGVPLGTAGGFFAAAAIVLLWRRRFASEG